jgi:hypothetical protein
MTVPVELAIVIGKGGKNIKLKDAMSHVAGYGEISLCPPDSPQRPMTDQGSPHP